MAGIKIDPEMLDIYMESLNKLKARQQEQTEAMPDWKYQVQERQRMDWDNIMRKSTSWEMI